MIKRWVNNYKIYVTQSPHTNRSPRNTLRPSTNSKMMSNRLADTIIKSNMFQPHRKQSLESAINFRMHSNVKIDVNTCGIDGRRLIYHDLDGPGQDGHPGNNKLYSVKCIPDRPYFRCPTPDARSRSFRGARGPGTWCSGRYTTLLLIRITDP